MRLTKTLIDEATHEGSPRKQVILWDDDVKGLGVRVYPSGRKAFVLRYRNKHNVRRFLTLGRYGTITLHQARQLARQRLLEVAGGADPARERKADRETITVAELGEAFLERHAMARLKTWREYRSLLETHVYPALGNRPAVSVTRGDVAKIHSAIGRDRQRTANKVVDLVRRVWNLADKWGLLPEGAVNPGTKLERYREPSRDRWLTPDEVRRLVEAVDAETSPRSTMPGSLSDRIVRAVEGLGEATIDEVTKAVDHPRQHVAVLLSDLARRGALRHPRRGVYAVAENVEDLGNLYLRAALWLYLLTGARKNEILRLRWDDVDLDGREIRLRQRKAGDDLVLPISYPAVAILEALPRAADNPHVFPGRKKGQPLTTIDRGWRRIRKAAGLEDVRLHDLRRTVGSWLVQAGNSLLVAQKALGHKTYEATLVYARLGEDPIRRAMDEHAARVLAAVKPKEK